MDGLSPAMAKGVMPIFHMLYHGSLNSGGAAMSY
jgi:hypothetical protein